MAAFKLRDCQHCHNDMVYSFTKHVPCHDWVRGRGQATWSVGRDPRKLPLPAKYLRDPGVPKTAGTLLLQWDDVRRVRVQRGPSFWHPRYRCQGGECAPLLASVGDGGWARGARFRVASGRIGGTAFSGGSRCRGPPFCEEGLLGREAGGGIIEGSGGDGWALEGCVRA
ncbi:hypothetical protein NDU88_005984 [Pleurodeles waltl]|uniref:Uncharacterized protein n=1 Tax=Pleurodeles waltl TaxID=8319 RepID=A0AAV7PJQ8_PLEWA|nr:hypothetical protein NDU88_005984 [Pleurodeles waltl]